MILNELNIKIIDLDISEEAKKALNSMDIFILNDFNHRHTKDILFDLNDDQIYYGDVLDKVLIKYLLPRRLDQQFFTSDYIEHLNQIGIYDLTDLLNVNRTVLLNHIEGHDDLKELVLSMVSLYETKNTTSLVDNKVIYQKYKDPLYQSNDLAQMISKEAIDKVKSFNINTVEDMDNFSFYVLDAAFQDSFHEITNILRLKRLPSSLAHHDLSMDTIELLNQYRINNLSELLSYNRDELFELVSKHETDLNQIKKTIAFYECIQDINDIRNEQKETKVSSKIRISTLNSLKQSNTPNLPLIDHETYVNVVLNTINRDKDYFTKDYHIQLLFKEGKVVQHNFDTFFKGYDDDRSLLLHLYSSIWFLQAYIIDIKFSGIKSEYLDVNKVYQLGLKINTNGIDITSKKGFGTFIFVDSGKVLTGLELALEALLTYIKTHSIIQSVEIHDAFIKSINFLIFDIDKGLDQARLKMISNSQSFFIK